MCISLLHMKRGKGRVMGKEYEKEDWRGKKAREKNRVEKKKRCRRPRTVKSPAAEV